ncbi:MAG: hypothetical protein AMXMBFR59_30920 [Rhodanobacteraceae bacterium]
MSRKYVQSDFPLKPADRWGRVVAAGDEVRISAIPDTDFHGFDDIGRARYTALKDRVLPVTALEENGYAVFFLWYLSSVDLIGNIGEPTGIDAHETHEFYFDPRDLEFV